MKIKDNLTKLYFSFMIKKTKEIPFDEIMESFPIEINSIVYCYFKLS